jgi:hypothetical protein
MGIKIALKIPWAMNLCSKLVGDKKQHENKLQISQHKV